MASPTGLLPPASPTSKPAGPRHLRDGTAQDPTTKLWPQLEFDTGRDLVHLRTNFLSYKADVTEDEGASMRLIMTELEIQYVVSHLASRINDMFRHSATRDQPVVMCGILNGVCWFFSDLMKRLDVPYDVTFAKFGSYGAGMTQNEGSKKVAILDAEKFKGRKVLILDELEDNGKTMNTVRQHIMDEMNVPEKDITTCVIFSKSKASSDVTKKGMRKCDLIGVYIPDVWLIGYGLDSGGTRRGWVHLFGTPKIAGVPQSPDDGMFVTGTESRDADLRYEESRRDVVKQLLKTRESYRSGGTPFLCEQETPGRKRPRTPLGSQGMMLPPPNMAP